MTRSKFGGRPSRKPGVSSPAPCDLEGSQARPCPVQTAELLSAAGDCVPVSDEETLRNWFPATRADFASRCGEVKALQAADLADVHRRRHLESFKKSMDEWASFGEGRGSGGGVSAETVDAFLAELLALAPKTASEADAACQSLRRKHKAFPSKAQLVAAYERLFASRSSPAVGVDAAASSSPPPTAPSASSSLPCTSSSSTSPPSSLLLADAAESSAVLPGLQGSVPVGRDSVFASLLRRKAVRTNSGVAVITVLTAPGKFSCPHDCHYCPQEPGQPRSYLSTEPAVLRANQNGWSAFRQFSDRASTLRRNGHVVDKVEVLVLGGTWSGYPASYQEEFVRDVFYAANVFGEPQPTRSALSLEEEQRINEEAKCRIVGLTLVGLPSTTVERRRLREAKEREEERCSSAQETRPDFVTRHELRRLRRFGCTRVQLGIQHVEDRILDFVNRGCHRRHAIKAIRMLKDAAFKVDIHLMPDLPSSDPDSDRRMFYYVLSSPDLQADQWKIYPCEVTPFSTIERWYHEGKFVPYAEREGGADLVRVVLAAKAAVHPWIRLNRVVRDIPNPSVIGGNAVTNLRQELAKEMKSRRLSCKCIRCREVGDGSLDLSEAQLRIREYSSNGGSELFLSFETPDATTIFGFLRLRLRGLRSPRDCPFSCLNGAALLRELHIYGCLVAHGESKSLGDARPQHAGLGRRLIQAAEILALSREFCFCGGLAGFQRMAVIAGVGTREYYRQSGYSLQDTFMLKCLSEEALDCGRADLKASRPSRLFIERQNLRLAASAVCLPLPPPVPTPSRAALKKPRRPKKTQDFFSSRTLVVEESRAPLEQAEAQEFDEALRRTEILSSAFRLSAVASVETVDVKEVLARLRQKGDGLSAATKASPPAECLKGLEGNAGEGVGVFSDVDSFAVACEEFAALEEAQRKSAVSTRDAGPAKRGECLFFGLSYVGRGVALVAAFSLAAFFLVRAAKTRL